jgi:hypothetical protein
METRCPRCDARDIWRVARSGLRDMFQEYLGRWPWKCRRCGLKFHLELRKVPEGAPTPRRPAPAYAPPVAHVAKQETSHTATITVKTETPQQMDMILLALAEAVKREEQKPSARPHAQSRF